MLVLFCVQFCVPRMNNVMMSLDLAAAIVGMIPWGSYALPGMKGQEKVSTEVEDEVTEGVKLGYKLEFDAWRQSGERQDLRKSKYVWLWRPQNVHTWVVHFRGYDFLSRAIWKLLDCKTPPTGILETGCLFASITERKRR